MHVGVAMNFQNPGRRIPDSEVYANELKLADLVEPLGFDSIFGIEHHFTDYICCPDVTQFLTYMAGRTRSASALPSWYCPGTTPCGWRRRSPCWIRFPVGG